MSRYGTTHTPDITILVNGEREINFLGDSDADYMADLIREELELDEDADLPPFEFVAFDDMGDGIDWGEYITNLDQLAGVVDKIEGYGDSYLAFVFDAPDYYWDSNQDFDRVSVCEDAEDYARQYTEDVQDIPSHVAMYLDYERMGEDMLRDVTYAEYNGQLYILND